MRVLGIETSCDETAVAVVDMDVGQNEPRILAQQVYSQVKEHAPYGGVVPEIASRAHLERLPILYQQTLTEAGLALADIHGIAATRGPGLVGSLMVGLTFAKSLAAASGKPFVGVDHLHGHALTARLAPGVEFPYVLLLVSGGHCQLELVESATAITLLGQTRDDAVGECFDKAAKLLELSPASGASIEKLAASGDAARFILPLPMNDGSLDFSFSGLKTAVRQRMADVQTEQDKADMCAALQAVIGKILAKKLGLALQKTGVKTAVAAGGVAANGLVRALLEKVCSEHGAQFVAPPLNLCTDNAAMIAYAGGLRLLRGESDELDITAYARRT